MKDDFLKDIFCLDNLPEMAEIVDDGNNLVLLTNETPNSPCLLQLPEYLPNK